VDSLPEGSIILVSEPLLPGGIAVYTSSIMEGLAEKKIPHPALTSTTPFPNVLPAEEIENVHVLNGLFWSGWRPLLFRRICNWAREQEPLLIHGLSAVTTPVCSRLAEALGIPFLITVHHFQKKNSLRVEKRCKGFIAVSEVLRENLVNDALIPKESVHLIPAGIRAVDVAPQKPRETRSSVPLVSSFGKLIRRKDFQTFLRAARIVVDKAGPDVSFVISGEGPDESALRKLTRELNIDKQVTFAHGSAAHARLLHDTDVYVQCSRAEGFGTMVLQAMAHGVPVVATSTGGILSLIRHGENGFLVPVGDAEGLAEHIVRLLADAELRSKLGDAARQAADKSFNFDHMMSRTLELYTECLADATARA